ncbi:MAG TPA: DNA recombination protein RmuC [Puia sp.]|nr:DNA recombination protein RmuC [Puia sp.]
MQGLETLGLIIIGLVIGWVLCWLWSKARHSEYVRKRQEGAAAELSVVQQELVRVRTAGSEQVSNLRADNQRLVTEKTGIGNDLVRKTAEMVELQKKLAAAEANEHAASESLAGKNDELKVAKAELAESRQITIRISQELAQAEAENRALDGRMKLQLQEIERLQQKSATEFENIANRILEAKSTRFTELNKTNLEAILDPLGKSISEFKEQVEKVYHAESKERFSLGEKVKDLAELNQQLSQEAKNLTRALKGEAKTQGRWGEVILETILEKSGLRKGEEYFMEHQLYAADGQPLRSELKGSKMRPDAVVKYPDDRHVIIDSKVSINAFVRATETEDQAEQQVQLLTHVQAVRSHVLDLQNKAYDDYDKTLDFVMLFIPSEAAYVAAIQMDPELWYYAFDRRILLINPTNLIVTLKLIVDLWKREYQNRNAQAIAERGGKLYDKFVGFVNNLQGVGKALDAAKGTYDEAFKQLSTGRDNLVVQATKLKNLGVKTGGSLQSELVVAALAEEENGNGKQE